MKSNEELEQKKHYVKKAIIMAAGEGKRLRPLTYSIPKPLIMVNGKRMLDTAVEALHQNGINDIYVVIGHLKEQFYKWSENEQGVYLIENPYYMSCNNISSLYVAREYLEESIILDGDQIIYNPSVVEPSFARSGYNAVWCKKQTEEWLMQVENGIVKSCSRHGGSHGWQLYSISRWTAQDGKRLKKQVEEEFENGNRQIYWDDIAMFCHFDDYELGIREMQAMDVVEIDSLKELVKVDNKYDYLLQNK